MTEKTEPVCLGRCAAPECGAPVWSDMAHVKTSSGLVIHTDCVFARMAKKEPDTWLTSH